MLNKISEYEMPNIVMPLTIEPIKPRLCHDQNFLNLWVRCLPFQMKTLKNVHRLFGYIYFFITTEEKSGYIHVQLLTDSQGYFRPCFGVCILWYVQKYPLDLRHRLISTAPFGWL